MALRFAGEVFSGIGKGKYYVGHPEYQKRFDRALGYKPYPGTLNVRLLDPGDRKEVGELRARKGIRIDPFTFQGEGFSALTCFDGAMSGERVTVLLIDITHYNESVVELISPVFLRGRFGLKDGDRVEFTVEPGDSTPGMR
ncbi:MAG: CTP-dependent riboflavin kinase [Thaumarchaeota archaeon]|nr:CTP-dependent riboflavin kinase [Nitrososphaerota archaeon]